MENVEEKVDKSIENTIGEVIFEDVVW